MDPHAGVEGDCWVRRRARAGGDGPDGCILALCPAEIESVARVVPSPVGQAGGHVVRAVDGPDGDRDRFRRKDGRACRTNPGWLSMPRAAEAGVTTTQASRDTHHRRSGQRA